MVIPINNPRFVLKFSMYTQKGHKDWISEDSKAKVFKTILHIFIKNLMGKCYSNILYPLSTSCVHLRYLWTCCYYKQNAAMNNLVHIISQTIYIYV